jgi:hypothetical protein
MLLMKSCVFWNITPCSPLKVNRRFGGTRRYHLQGFLLGLFYKPEIGGDYTTLHSRRHNSS